MKIALISPSKTHLADLTAVLESAGHSVLCTEGGKSRLPQVIEAHRPQLVLLDGMCADPGELDAVEQAAAMHPQLAVVLMCAQQSADFLLRAMRAGVREVLPSPVPGAVLLEAIRRIEDKLQSPRPPRRGRLLAFMPCKGGSGATFLAVNLAHQLAAHKRVLLIDLNLQFGDALTLVHDKPPVFTVADVARDVQRLDASLLAASSVQVTPHFSVLAAPEDFSQAMEVQAEHVHAIVALALEHHDFVLLDLPRNLDHMNVQVLDLAERVFIVMQTGLPWLRHARRLKKVFQSLDYAPDKVEWIVNRYERTGEIGLEEIARTLGIDRLRTVANAYKEVQAAVNHGTALSETARSGQVMRNLAELALSLAPRQTEQPSLLGRLFRRA